MPAFSYEAVDETGLTKKGVVNADSTRGAQRGTKGTGVDFFIA